MNEELFPEIESYPMRHILHEEKSSINGTTIRLLRCRDETASKTNKYPSGESVVTIGRTKNELVASYWDSKRSKHRDFIRMLVADTLPEAMPTFLKMSIKEIKRLLPKYKSCDKVAKVDCRTVHSYDGFAEAMQRR